ncbi:nucleotidyltransferase family protein [Aureimonas psammosilenae]|uniref:hypothetical protein n=1 Tax=Aureimonas psammosilenae TaxID=2495496 RepID=UPI0012605A18|nr:hypothetical protein [Aureimonas psammosilenae]
MARDIGKRLSSLKTRRRGTDRLGRIATDTASDIYAKRDLTERYEQLADGKPYTRYALGSMQQVDPDYTRIGIEEATRVGNQLNKQLPSEGVAVAFELQGSVPCNIHIRGVSDVDLLVLRTEFVTYDSTPGLNSYTSTNYTPLAALRQLRTSSERILKSSFPKADVDTTGAKAIAISGGSLRRPVDVVPSHWHDTADYQRTYDKDDRGVKILDNKQGVTLLNMPFRHIKLVTTHDIHALYGLKKAIRLCKHVKNDAIEEGRTINYSSFDLASTLWHANMNAFAAGYKNELAILIEARRFMDELYHNVDKAKSLLVPDGSRKIFDAEAKIEGMKIMSYELDDLAKEVAFEQASYAKVLYEHNWSELDKIMKSTGYSL